MAETEFHVWVTLLSDSPTDLFVSGLVRRGWKVGPLAGDGKVSEATDMSCLLAIVGEADPGVLNASAGENVEDWAMAECVTVLTERQLLFHSIVINVVGGTYVWRVGNITRTKLPKQDVYDRLRKPEL